MMQHQGWRRFLPDRSQFMLLVIVVIALVAGMSFVNLGIARNSALAHEPDRACASTTRRSSRTTC